MIFKIQSEGFIHPITVSVTINDSLISITSPYNPQLVHELRAMQGSKWNKEARCWQMPLTDRNTYAIEYLTGKRSHYYNPLTTFPLITTLPLYPHQEEAVQFILNKRRILLAYQMGLGKTMIAFAVMEEAFNLKAQGRPGGAAIWWVVAPSGAQKEWKRQIRQWNPQIRPTAFSTYESLHKLLESYDTPPDGVIFDESIKIKNPAAQRSQVASELARLIRQNSGCYILAMSGAPAPKDPTEWWHQLEVCCPGFIREGSVHKFRDRLAVIEYVDGEYGRYPELKSWKEDEIKALGKRLRPICLLKTRDECFNFPDKIYDIIHTTPSQTLMATAITLLDSSESVLIGIEKCRQLSDGFQYKHETSPITGKEEISGVDWIGSPKIKIIEELLNFYAFENGGPGRLIIYAGYRAMIDKLTEVVKHQGWAAAPIHQGTLSRSDSVGYQGTVRIGKSNGKVTKVCGDIIDDFQDRPSEDGNMCIITNPARIHGLTLTRTEALVYYSNTYDRDARQQSEDRRDRPGMDITKGTRIVDIINLPTDLRVKEALETSEGLAGLTMEGLKECLS